MILAVDPGREKCGIAVAAPDGAALLVKNAAISDFESELQKCMNLYEIQVIVCGDGTGKNVVELLKKLGKPVVIIDETDSTREARHLYFEENPPGCLYTFIPRGMWYPKEPVDRYAALVLARRYIGDFKK